MIIKYARVETQTRPSLEVIQLVVTNRKEIWVEACNSQEEFDFFKKGMQCALSLSGQSTDFEINEITPEEIKKLY